MIRLALVLAVVLGACTSSDSGSVIGTVRGTQLTVVDAIARVSNDSLEIIMSTSPDICNDLLNNVSHRGENVVLIDLVNSAHTAVATGTYTVVDAGSSARPALGALFEINLSDGTCTNNADNDPTGSSGTVTLSSVGGAFSGSFDVVMSSGDAISGSFDSSECSGTISTAADTCI